MSFFRRFMPQSAPPETVARRGAARGNVPTPRDRNVTIFEPHVEQGGRTVVMTTDRELQIGAEPAHIDRIKRAMNVGYVGARNEVGFERLVATERYIGHVPLVHRVVGPAPSYAANTFDDHAYIPAVMVGNPVESPS